MGGATRARGRVQENSGGRGRSHREYDRTCSRGKLSYGEKADWHCCERQRKNMKETAGGSNSRGGRIFLFFFFHCDWIKVMFGGFGRHGDGAGVG